MNRRRLSLVPERSARRLARAHGARKRRPVRDLAPRPPSPTPSLRRASRLHRDAHEPRVWRPAARQALRHALSCGVYLASIRTMYRLLALHFDIAPDRRAQRLLSHLCAVARSEQEVRAASLHGDVRASPGGAPGSLTVLADRGGPVRSDGLAQLFADSGSSAASVDLACPMTIPSSRVTSRGLSTSPTTASGGSVRSSRNCSHGAAAQYRASRGFSPRGQSDALRLKSGRPFSVKYAAMS